MNDQTSPPPHPSRPAPGQITADQLDNWFSHHPPTSPEQIAAYQSLRSAGRYLAALIVQSCPPSADTTAAVRKVREAVMTANAAIACGGR